VIIMTEVAINLLAGGLVVPLLQIIKRALHLGGTGMLWTTCGVSVAIAAGISGLSGGAGFAEFFQNPELILTGGGTILATATIVYRACKGKMHLSEDSK